MSSIPFQTINWDSIEKTEHAGDTGISYWRTIQFDGLRLRKVEYTAGYFANHWCQKGHIVYCIEGSFTSELSTGENFTLKKGDTYIVSDNLSSHRSISEDGVILLIIDGDFLQNT
jgi:quercetin dioxygenase-like cupin family protein